MEGWAGGAAEAGLRPQEVCRVVRDNGTHESDAAVPPCLSSLGLFRYGTLLRICAWLLVLMGWCKHAPSTSAPAPAPPLQTHIGADGMDLDLSEGGWTASRCAGASGG